MRLTWPIVLGFKKHQVEKAKQDDDSEVDTKVNIHTLYKHLSLIHI